MERELRNNCRAIVGELDTKPKH